MTWLFTIDIEDDLIVACRLLNIFRRKGLRLRTLAMASSDAGYRVAALMDAPEAEIDHIFHFLRRTEGVSHVAYYQSTRPGSGSYIFFEPEAERLDVAQWPHLFPGARLVFASHGSALIELPAPAPGASAFAAPEIPGLIPFACVRNTRAANAAWNAGRDQAIEN
jgi:hypothetical protein